MSSSPRWPPLRPADEVRALLSLREATVLAGVPEAKVRKDIETGILLAIRARNPERLLFRWADVYGLAAAYRGDLLSGALRRKVFEALEAVVEPICRRHVYDNLDQAALMAATCPRHRPDRLLASCDRLRLDHYVFIDLGEVMEDVAPRVDLYAEGLARIEEREGVLGGEAVFRSTRLSVRHIGKMREGGETIEAIIDDYPYLRKEDVEFARLYHKAHPLVGRPRRLEEVDLAGHPSSHG